MCSKNIDLNSEWYFLLIVFFFHREFTDIISNYYFNEAYVKTHMKMIIYFIGILTGYILHRIQTEKWV